jgi:hypothetical protein
LLHNLQLFCSIVSKSVEYWQNLYDKGIIEEHAFYLRLNNLKYAVDKNLITSEEYYIHSSRYKLYRPSYINYKPYSLLDFSKRLKSCSINHQKIDQSIQLIQYDEKKTFKAKKNIENINLQHKTTLDLNKLYKHIEQESNQLKVDKKSKRKRKKKNNLNGNSYYRNTVRTDITENNDYELKQNENSVKQNLEKSKNAVKIFVRKINKEHKNETVNKISNISTKKSVREVFSRIVKQLKMER